MNKYEALTIRNGVEGGQDVEEEPEQLFDFLKEAIEKANNEILPRVAREPKRPWMHMTYYCWWKKDLNTNVETKKRHGELNGRIKREGFNAEVAWMDNACEEIEDLVDRRDQTRVYSKVN